MYARFDDSMTIQKLVLAYSLFRHTFDVYLSYRYFSFFFYFYYFIIQKMYKYENFVVDRVNVNVPYIQRTRIYLGKRRICPVKTGRSLGDP